MKEFCKSKTVWLKVIIISAGIIFGAGRISHSFDQLKEQVKSKLDKEIYERDCQHFQRELDLRLGRIEEKIDALNPIHKNSPGRLRTQEP